MTHSRLTFDAENQEWDVIDRNGDVDSSHDSRFEALAAAQELDADDAESDRLEERDNLIDEIQGLVSDKDNVTQLRMVLDLLKSMKE